ncbi:MAG TPA: FTR1 family protein [Candidatus Binataceae bacterium]|nr:FTR1 family protein [Candidatus Binataceae bacterium]
MPAAPATISYFLYSVGILLREGTEAMLVVVALGAATREAGDRRGVRDVYAGAIAAVIASIGLAVAVNYVISDDASDTLEGIFQLLAAGTLFYVSSWLTSKSQAESWNKFIVGKFKSAQQSAAPAAALALTAFLAVIREGAETIVFFQALVSGASAGAERHAVAAGIAAATVTLAVAFVIVNRAASRIPFGLFFKATSVLLYAMAVIFVGQGVASLQEADRIGATFLDHVPTIAALGVFPTVQTLAAQAILMLLAAAAIFAAKPRTSEPEAENPAQAA